MCIHQDATTVPFNLERLIMYASSTNDEVWEYVEIDPVDYTRQTIPYETGGRHLLPQSARAQTGAKGVFCFVQKRTYYVNTTSALRGNSGHIIHLEIHQLYYY